jgi:signal transduction histidine kinase
VPSENRSLIADAATGGNGGDALLSHSLLLGERLYFFSRLRFLAAAGILTGGLFAIHVVGIQGLNLGALAGTAIFLAMCNLAVFFALRPYRRPERAASATRPLVWIASATILLDYLVLTFTIWLVGGSQSPFLAFYVLHAIFASAMLSRRAAFVHAAVGYLMLAALVLGEWFGWLPRYRPLGAVFGGPENDFRVVWTLLFLYGLLMSATTYLATGIAARLRASERRLREAVLRLERLADLRRSFLHVVVHDLRSPLGAVTTLLDNLSSELGGPLSGQQRQWVERADHRLRGALELLRGLQVLADLETESLAKLMVSVDLRPIVQEVVEEYADLAQQRRQSLTAELADSLPPVRGIARLLREALVNYVTNAIKYSGDGRTLVVRVHAQDTSLRVEVQDDGPGIPPEEQTRLFQEFVRVSKGKGAEAGTGLGLSIVRRIAEAHGGQVGVESTPGQGSCFFLTLPISKSVEEHERTVDKAS